MSQAKKSNSMSRLSRRDALAGLSVAAVAGVAALPAGAAEVDPRVEPIADHDLGPAIRYLGAGAASQASIGGK